MRGGSRSCAVLTRVRNAERCGVYAAAASEQLMLGRGWGVSHQRVKLQQLHAPPAADTTPGSAGFA